MGRYFDFSKKDPKPISEKKERIRKHNAMIIEKRRKGELKPLGTVTYSQIVHDSVYDRKPKAPARLSVGGSILMNKWALWPDDDYCDKCY